ncbi:hypothetical protein CsSME_00008948 [Camellia sinensis var. sinensis]
MAARSLRASGLVFGPLGLYRKTERNCKWQRGRAKRARVELGCGLCQTTSVVNVSQGARSPERTRD